MSLPPDSDISLEGIEEILEGISTVFESLGRGLICLGPDFLIVHVSSGLEQLVGEGTVERMLGRPVEEVLGENLFGENGTLRKALQAGERREGWGASIKNDDGLPRLVSLTAAPIQHKPDSVCDPRVAFVIVVRPAEEDDENRASATTIFSNLVARSASMQKIFQLIGHLEGSDATVLITGESGTGKELIARAVHVHSPRRGGPFVAVNCGALPPDLLESELFGHVRGAFTGAVRDRVGRFEAAHNGTIFLDEIAELPLHLQVKLLRVLQEKTFERVGESRSRNADARVIAATNKVLRRAVLDGEFRDDLYYRLRVVPIEVPPLRDRREDIEPIARHLLDRVSRRHGRSVRFAQGAIDALLTHDWPGNVREIENALEYAVAICTGQTVHEQDLPQEVLSSPAEQIPIFATPPPADSSALTGPNGVVLSPDAEREKIRMTLEAHRWRRTEAARALGFSRTTLWRKMRELGLLR